MSVQSAQSKQAARDLKDAGPKQTDKQTDNIYDQIVIMKKLDHEEQVDSDIGYGYGVRCMATVTVRELDNGGELKLTEANLD